MEPIRLNRDSTLSENVGLWYSQLKEVRKNLIDRVKAFEMELLDFTPDPKKVESIGTLLFHIAGVEWSWIFEDIDHKEMDMEEWKHAFPLRSWTNIDQINGKEIAFYLDLLEKVRTQVYERLKSLANAQLTDLAGAEEQKVTIEWIFFHLIEHESLHIGQISLLRRLYQKQLESD